MRRARPAVRHPQNHAPALRSAPHSRSTGTAGAGLRHQRDRWAGTIPTPFFLLHGWMDTGDTFQFLVDALPGRAPASRPDWRGSAAASGRPTVTGSPILRRPRGAARPFRPGPPGHTGSGTAWAAHRHDVRGHPAGARAGGGRMRGFGLSRTRPEQAPALSRVHRAGARERRSSRASRSVEAFRAPLARRNPRLTPETCRVYLLLTWTERLPDGGVQCGSDPVHKRVNPVL